jgi:uncharacterized protein YndB with AHSA1/START domain
MQRDGDGDVPSLRGARGVTQPIEHSIEIGAAPAEVWRALTTPAVMVEWMAEPEMRLEVDADWTVGAPISMRGVHHAAFRNTRVVERGAYVPRPAPAHPPTPAC